MRLDLPVDLWGAYMLDVDAVRKDFPSLKEGQVYLDSAASSLTPDPVIRKMVDYYSDYRANVGRGYTAFLGVPPTNSKRQGRRSQRS